jgi:hypothetical protein
MIAFKASYLLMYPYVMGLVGTDQQVRTIGLLSVVVHLGAIAGATLGGGVLHYLSPARMFVLMGLMDFVQMAVSLLLLRHAPQPARVDANTPPRAVQEHLAIIRLCLLMLAFYFCVYLARPFFTLYWEQLGGPQASWITGLVYAIPGMLALLALALHYHAGQHLTAWLLLGAAGLALQGIEQMPTVLAGPDAVRLGAVPAHRRAGCATVRPQPAGALRPRLQPDQHLPEPRRTHRLLAGRRGGT